MSNRRKLPEVIHELALEPDCDACLDILARAALDLTQSRLAMIAVLNDELGCLEVRYGAGEEFEARAKDERLKIDVSDDEGIVAYVAATGESLKSDDVRHEPRYRKLFGKTASEIAFPVRDRHQRIRAVLNVESDSLNAYGDREMEITGALSDLVALVLDQKEHASREEALIEIGGALESALTEEALLDRVIQVASDVLRFQACSIFLYEQSSETYVLRASSSKLKERVGEIRYKANEGCTGWVCATGEPILLDNPQGDPRWRGRHVEFPSEQIASFLAVPIVQRGRPIGAIRVIRRVSDNKYLDLRFTPSDERVLSAIADQVATGLENVRNMERIIRSERMIAWGELSAKSSHMIGNRVFALKGDINELRHLLAEREPDVKELRALQDSLATNVMRVEEILQDFRDFVSATQLHREPGDLNALIRETAQEVFPRRSAVELQLELAEDLPPVSMDAKKLRRAISELIENSMNYMDRGRLRVATRLVFEPAGKEGHPFKGQTFVEIEVEDTGPGVEEEQKTVIFQPFFSGRVKGMGLGLSIVKGIVDAHGGHVFEAGEEGKGAKFVILMPVSDRP